MTAEDAPDACPVCGSTGAHRFPAREMMFGLRDRFTYCECTSCGCLRLADVPEDLSRYYPPAYYSFHPQLAGAGWKEWLRNACAAHLLGRRRALLGALLFRVRRPMLNVAAVGRTGIQPGGAILDVGAGAGALLDMLHRQGYHNVSGIDPFLEEDLEYADRFTIRKAYLAEVEGVFDLLIMDQSLEHMPDHVGILRTAHRLTAPDGALLIRTPIAARSWREYGADWVELDAPRHLIVHSEQSIRQLARRTGFHVADMTYDATSLELWGSEQYRRDIPLIRGARGVLKPSSVFSRRQLWKFERRVARMNRAGEAGRASIILRPG